LTSNDITDKASSGEARTGETQSLIRRVKRRAPRKSTGKEKIRVVVVAFRHEMHLKKACRRKDMQAYMYDWHLGERLASVEKPSCPAIGPGITSLESPAKRAGGQ